MSTSELIEQAQYVVDGQGKKRAIMLDIDVWERLLDRLGESELSAQFESMPSRVVHIPSVRLAPESRRPEITVTIE